MSRLTLAQTEEQCCLLLQNLQLTFSTAVVVYGACVLHKLKMKEKEGNGWTAHLENVISSTWIYCIHAIWEHRFDELIHLPFPWVFLLPKSCPPSQNSIPHLKQVHPQSSLVPRSSFLLFFFCCCLFVFRLKAITEGLCSGWKVFAFFLDNFLFLFKWIFYKTILKCAIDTIGETMLSLPSTWCHSGSPVAEHVLRVLF